MNVWKIVCATLVIFIAGIGTGVVLVRLGERGPRAYNRLRPDAINRPPANPVVTNAAPAFSASRPNNPFPGNNVAPLNREFLPLLEREVRLNHEQREKIQHIMKTSQERIRELRVRIEPEIRAEIQKAQEHIRALLTPEQQDQYQQLMKRSQRRNETMPPLERRRDVRIQRGPQAPLGDPENTPARPPAREPEPNLP